MADEPLSDDAANRSESTETTDGIDSDSSSVLGSVAKPRYVIALVGIVVFAALPFTGISTTQLLVLIGAFYFGMFAMSWDTVSGYTGEISFGHALFFAVGGYTSTLLNLGYGVSPALSIPAGVVLAAVAGVLIGVPALRVRGPYLSLITLVAPLILLQVFVIFGDIFGGELGLSAPTGLVDAADFDLVVLANYYVGFGLFLGIMALLFVVTRSDVGSVLTAVREDEDAVAAAGLNVAKFKLFAFVLSAAVGGLAGAVFVHTPIGSPRPSQLLALTVSIEVLIAAILGGMGTIVGAGLGGVFFYFFNDVLNQQDWSLPLVGVGINEASLLVFALLTMVVVYALPSGVVPWALRTGRRLLGRARGRQVATDGGTTDHGSTTDDPRERGGSTPLESAADRFRRFFERDDTE